MSTEENHKNISQWKKYLDLEPIKRLRCEGRELLGKDVYLTEKRDGENVSIWLDQNDQVHISSHNLEAADSSIIQRLQSTKEYSKAVAMLKEEKTYQHNFILYGELMKEVGPTKIEPRRKKVQWILFDMYDCEEKRYLNYNGIYQKAYHYKIPVVRTVALIHLNTMEELTACVAEYLLWCRRHRREGIVGKDYDNQVFFKEKIDLPKIKKVKSNIKLPQLPVMPEDKIIRALQHAYDEVGAENWKNVKVAMPIVAKHISMEAAEHNYQPPHNYYNFYVNTPLEVIAPKAS